MNDLVLKHGLSFADLYDREGLVRLDRAFITHLAETDAGLHDRLMAARRDPDVVERLEESNLLVDLAPHLEDFIGELFGVEPEIRALQARHTSWHRSTRSSASAPSKGSKKPTLWRSTGPAWRASSIG